MDREIVYSLRKNNYIMSKGIDSCFYARIFHIYQNYYAMTDHGHIYLLNPEIQPIPLTIEILRNSNLKDLGSDIFSISNNLNISFGKCIAVFDEDDDKDKLYLECNEEYMIKRIDFVHELQNLYYYLNDTNRDLKIVL